MDIPKLQFFKTSVICQKHSAVWDFSNIPRPFFSMGLILDGHGRYIETNSEPTEVSAGDIIVIPDASTYISYWVGEPDITYLSVHFVFEKGFDRQAGIQKIPNCSYLKDDFEFICYHFSDNKAAFSVMSKFYYIISRVYPQIKFAPQKNINSSVKKAVDYITQHYKEDISLKQLADIVALSPSRFYAVFKKETGLTAIEYKNLICLRNAQKLLVATELTVEEISERLGFNSSTYFRRIFKRFTGKSPTEYRFIVRTQMLL